MDDDPLTQLITSRAYKIFLVELTKHLASAKESLLGTSDPSREQCISASRNFHTIRGGAGFFLLHDIANVAGQLEELLESPSLVFSAERSRIEKLLASFEAFADKLPHGTEPKST